MEHKPNKTELISILICSRDRHDDLASLVHSLNKTAPSLPKEIVVVEETHKPAPIDGVKYISHPVLNRGIPYARNLAVTQASGEIILFLDDDCLITENWFDTLVEPFQDDTVVGVQGGVTVPFGTNSFGWAESILGFPGGGIRRVVEAKGEIGETTEISTLNCAYRKWVIEKVGGFDENLTLGSEDYLLAKQACLYGRCLFVPNALVFHEPRGSLKKIWRWFVRRGRAEMRLVKLRRIEETNLGSILRRSITCKFILVVLVGVFSPGFFTALLVLALLAYAILQFVRYFGPWKLSKAPLTTFFLLPLVKLVMDLATDWGRVRESFFD